MLISRWRVATPLEESARSWSAKPTHINHELNKHVYEPYIDFDKDEHLVSEHLLAKKTRREEMKKAKAEKG